MADFWINKASRQMFDGQTANQAAPSSVTLPIAQSFTNPIIGLPQLWLPPPKGPASHNKPMTAPDPSYAFGRPLSSLQSSLPTNINQVTNQAGGQADGTSNPFGRQVVVKKVDLSGQFWQNIEISSPKKSTRLPEIREISESNISNRSQMDRSYNTNLNNTVQMMSPRSMKSEDRMIINTKIPTIQHIVQRERALGGISSEVFGLATPILVKSNETELTMHKRSIEDQNMIRELQENLREIQRNQELERMQFKSFKDSLQLKIAVTEKEFHSIRETLKESVSVNAVAAANHSIEMSKLQSELNSKIKAEIQLKEEIDSLQKNLRHAEKMVHQLQTELCHMQLNLEENSSVDKQAKQDMYSENKRLQELLHQEELQKVEQIRLIAALQFEIQNMKSDTDEGSRKQASLRQEIQSCKATIANLLAERNGAEQIRGENDKLKKQIIAIHGKIQEYEGKVEKYQQTYQLDRNYAIEAIKKLEEERDGEIRNRKAAEEQNSRLHSLYVNLQYEKQTLSEQVVRINAEMEQWKNENASLQKEMAAMIQTLELKLQETKQLQKQVQSLQEAYAKQSGHGNNIERQLTEALHHKQLQLQENQKNIQIIKRDISTKYEAENAQLLKQLQNIRGSVTKNKQELNGVLEQLQSARAELSEARNNAQLKQKSLEGQKQELLGDLEAIGRQSSCLQQTIRDREQRLREMEKQMSELRTAMEEIKRKNKQISEYARTLELKLGEYREQLQTTKSNLRKYSGVDEERQFLKNMVQQSQEEIQNYKNENRMLKKSLEDTLSLKEEGMRSLREQLQQKSAEVTELSYRVQQQGFLEGELKRSHQNQIDRMQFDYRNSIESLQRELENNQRQLKDMHARILQLEPENEELRKVQQQLAQANKKLTQEVESMEEGYQEQSHRLQIVGAKYKEQMRTLQSHYIQERKKREQLEAMLKEQKPVLKWSNNSTYAAQHRKQIRILEQKIQSQNATIEFLQNKLREQAATISKNIESLANLELRLSNHESDKNLENNRELQAKEQAFLSKEERLTQLISEHFDKLSKFPPQILNSKESVQVSFSSNSHQGYHIQKRLLILNQVIQIIETLSLQLRDAHKFTKEVLQKKITEQDRQIDRLTLEVHEAIYQRDHLINQVEMLIGKLKYVQDNLTYLTQVSTNSQEEISKLKNLNSILKSRLDKETDNREWLQNRITTTNNISNFSNVYTTLSNQIVREQKLPKINIINTIEKAKIEREEIMSKLKKVVDASSGSKESRRNPRSQMNLTSAENGH